MCMKLFRNFHENFGGLTLELVFCSSFSSHSNLSIFFLSNKKKRTNTHVDYSENKRFAAHIWYFGANSPVIFATETQIFSLRNLKIESLLDCCLFVACCFSFHANCLSHLRRKGLKTKVKWIESTIVVKHVDAYTSSGFFLQLVCSTDEYDLRLIRAPRLIDCTIQTMTTIQVVHTPPIRIDQTECGISKSASKAIAIWQQEKENEESG